MARTLVARPCPVCGTEFSVFKGMEKNKQYCSIACGHKARTALVTTKETRICACCGKAFEAAASSTVRMCSTRCSGLMKRKRETRCCLHCGTKFEVFEKSRVRHCSEECAYKARTEAVQRVPCVCKNCGKVDLVVGWRAKTRKYCSRKCMNSCPEILAARSEGGKGERNPQYKHGATYTAVSASGRVYKRQPLEKELAKSAKRRAKKQNAIPGWADLEAIEAIYAEARRFTEMTGEPFHVDHRVPLISDLVCGLHWEGNLQILKGEDNLSKGNKQWDDMP